MDIAVGQCHATGRVSRCASKWGTRTALAFELAVIATLFSVRINSNSNSTSHNTVYVHLVLNVSLTGWRRSPLCVQAHLEPAESARHFVAVELIDCRCCCISVRESYNAPSARDAIRSVFHVSELRRELAEEIL